MKVVRWACIALAFLAAGTGGFVVARCFGAHRNYYAVTSLGAACMDAKLAVPWWDTLLHDVLPPEIAWACLPEFLEKGWDPAHVSADKTEFGDPQLARLAEVFQRSGTVDTLALAKTSVTSSGLASLESCASLRKIAIEGPLADGRSLQQFRRQPHVEQIILRDCVATANDLADLPGIAAMKWAEIDSETRFVEVFTLQTVLATIRLSDAHGSHTIIGDASNSLSRYDPACGRAWGFEFHRLASRPRQPLTTSLSLKGAFRILETCPKLERLFLSCDLNQVDAASGLQSLTRLRRLDFIDRTYREPTPGAFAVFAGLESLEELVYATRSRSTITAEFLSVLARLPQLQSVSLIGVRVKSAELLALNEAPRLRRLILDRIILDSGTIADLAELIGLKELVIERTVDSTSTVMALRQRRSDLKITVAE